MEENIRKKFRIGKSLSLSIAAAFMFFLTDANAQEHTEENMNDTQEEAVTDSSEYHNLDYRQENNEDFGKKDKLKDDREKAYQDESNENQSGSFEDLDKGTHEYLEGEQSDQGVNTQTEGNKEDTYPENDPYREKKHEGADDGIYQDSDPYRQQGAEQDDDSRTRESQKSDEISNQDDDAMRQGNYQNDQELDSDSEGIQDDYSTNESENQNEAGLQNENRMNENKNQQDEGQDSDIRGIEVEYDSTQTGNERNKSGNQTDQTEQMNETGQQQNDYGQTDPQRNTRQNDQSTTGGADYQDDRQKTSQDSLDQTRQRYGLNQEIIEKEPTQEELQKSEENYKKYQDIKYSIATYQVLYPDMMFDYEYNERGELEGVTITGIENQEDKDQASEWLIQAHQLSDSLKYRKDENGVYYSTEQRARFKDGRQELYQELRGNLSYPEDAEDAGIEGVVQLRFIVDRFGNVQHLEAQEDIDGGDWIVDQMVEEAKNAFKRIDHNWIPGEIHNIEVPQWVTIPVHFSIKLPPGLQML